MNVVNNLNCVEVINKPCMREARYARLIPWTTLHSDSEQFIYNWKLENNLDLDQGNWRKLNAMCERKAGKVMLRYSRKQSRAEAVRKQKSC